MSLKIEVDGSSVQIIQESVFKPDSMLSEDPFAEHNSKLPGCTDKLITLRGKFKLSSAQAILDQLYDAVRQARSNALDFGEGED